MIEPHIMVGDCRTSLKIMALYEMKFQTCVTSPPYFGLRDYGHAEQLGLEPTPDEYVRNMVEVFRGVRDVLADDGTLWLNIGDSYARNASKGGSGKGGKNEKYLGDNYERSRSDTPPGLKEKDLIGIPWMLAFALRADGWYLRQDIIWAKPNPMPESVTDRCTKSHEYIFLLSKSQRYFFDYAAIKEPAVGAGGPGYTGGKYAPPVLAAHKGRRTARDNFKREDSKREQAILGQTVGTHRPGRDESTWDTAMRNKRDVWTVATRSYSGAHFAVFPPALIEPCILAGSRPGDRVLDPFGGSGTTAGVAIKHGRLPTICELNPEYAALVPQRIASIL